MAIRVTESWLRRVDNATKHGLLGTWSGTGVTRPPFGKPMAMPARQRKATAASPARGLFVVKVEMTGGTNGSATTAPSYTYRVRSVTWTGTGTPDPIIAEAVAVVGPREVGRIVVPSGSITYGLAFYESGTLKLWDAGERYSAGGCA